MKRISMALVFAAVVVVTACSPAETDGYAIFFDDRINLFEESVYYKGTAVGRVLSTEISSDNRAMVTIQVDSSHRYLMTDQATFYIDGGKLCYDSFKKFGNPIESGTRILGFSSKGSLRWFKAKTIFTQPASEAAEQAEAISNRFT